MGEAVKIQKEFDRKRMRCVTIDYQIDIIGNGQVGTVTRPNLRTDGESASYLNLLTSRYNGVIILLNSQSLKFVIERTDLGCRL